MDAARIVERLATAGLRAPRAASVVIDLTDDPPLGRSASATAVEEAERLVAGTGAAMLAARARRGVIAVRDAAAQEAIGAALRSLEAKAVQLTRMPDLWPSIGIDRDLGCRHAWVLDGEGLLDLEAPAFGRPRAPRRVTIAGAVARPGVLAIPARESRTVEELVTAAGGATAPGDAWVALDGGAYGGAIAEREANVRSSLLLVLPAAHPLVVRERLSVSDRLRRAASACEGCRACTDLCPVRLDGRALAPHALVATLVAGEDRGTAIAAASACTLCGVCNAACPSALAPAALIGAIRARLPADLSPLRRRRPHPDRAARRMSRELLLLRAGLAEGAAPDARTP